MKLKTVCLILLLITGCYAMAQSGKKDTAIVKQYNYVSVFYNCQPLHPYKVLGTGKGNGGLNFEGLMISAPKNLDGLYELYTSAAKAHYQNCTGITFSDLHLGRDIFTAIQTIHPDSREDTALFSTPIFVSAKPTRAYDTLGIMTGNTGFKSLNSNLAHHFQKAKKRYPASDGIILDNIDLLFGTYKIIVFRWKKP